MALVTGTANFVVMLSVVLASLDVATARNALILEKAGNCEPNSKIILNYTYTRATNKGAGHVEYLEKIHRNSNILCSTFVQYKGVQGSSDIVNSYHSMNISKSDLCVLLNTDMLYLPYMREFLYIGKYCPINKGIEKIHKSFIFLKRMSAMPMGCWKVQARIEKDGKLYSCMYIVVQIVPSLESQRIECG